MTLEALFNQDYPKDRYEVIVVDDGSCDDTPKMIETLSPPCQFRYLKEERIGQYRARNVGLNQACGEIIIFVDNDVLVVPEFIREHIYSHLHEENIILNGHLVYIKAPEEVGKARGFFDFSSSHFDTANVSIKREHLLKAGGFDENFLAYGWADLELGDRLLEMGLRVRRNPRALGYHYKRDKRLSDLETVCKYERMSGMNAAYYYKKHPRLRVRLATQFNPLFLFAPIGRVLDTERGRRLLLFLERRGLYLPLVIGVKLISYCHYLGGLREGKG